MQEDKKQRLEGMLRDVKEIKSDYYVGTKEAYEVLKEIQQIYSNPAKASATINDRLKALNPLTYIATPERVAGITKTITQLVFEIESEDEFIQEYYGRFEDVPDFEIARKIDSLDLLEHISHSDFMFFNPEGIPKAIYLFFADANSKSISSDEDFGKNSVNLLRREYEKSKNSIGFKKKKYCDNFMDLLLSNLSETNWNYVLSKRGLGEIERNRIYGAKANMRISTIVERVFRDKLDHRLEYRRQILCKWLEKFSEEPEEYETLVKLSENELRRSEKNLRNLENLNAPEEIIKHSERRVRTSRFIRHLLGADKNFVKRYLNH